MKILKVILFWVLVYSIYFLSKKFELDFVFNFVVATLFIAVIIRTINTERYNNLALKEEILRSIYDLICHLKQSEMGGVSKYFGAYPVLNKAKENAGIFEDSKIVTIIYKLDEAVNTKSEPLVRTLDPKYLHDSLLGVKSKKSLANFLIYEILVQIFFVLPLQMCKAIHENHFTMQIYKQENEKNYPKT